MSRYQCNCGQAFYEPEERTMHSANCVVFQNLLKKPRRWSSSHPGPTREMRDVVEASEYDKLKAAADRLADAWDKHQTSKFKSDGSHFQADLELNVALQDYRALFPKETT